MPPRPANNCEKPRSPSPDSQDWRKKGKEKSEAIRKKRLPKKLRIPLSSLGYEQSFQTEKVVQYSITLALHQPDNMTAASFGHGVVLLLLVWGAVSVTGFAGFRHHDPRAAAFAKPLNMTRKAAPPPGKAWEDIDMVVWAQQDGPTTFVYCDDGLIFPSLGEEDVVFAETEEPAAPSSTAGIETRKKSTIWSVQEVLFNSQQFPQPWQMSRQWWTSLSVHNTSALSTPSPSPNLWAYLVNRMALYKLLHQLERISQCNIVSWQHFGMRRTTVSLHS
jgi:hypothetical protein